ncbi:hypothetical protein Barb6_03615 [Bacteroidales bacterium Barb6]|nr:hypothetical protein Barb6_03615 [Bacteroidales bacterium Barb6]
MTGILFLMILITTITMPSNFSRMPPMQRDLIISQYGSIVGFIMNMIYTQIGILIVVIYIVITANALVASQVDRGSMAYTLSTPIKRSTVA